MNAALTAPARRGALGAGLAVLAAAWVTASAGAGVTGHMAAHMAAVAVAAPLLAFGLASVALYPCFWSAAEPLAAAWQRLRPGSSRDGATA